MHPYINEQIATQRVRELHTQAERSRLSAQAEHSGLCRACAQADQHLPHRLRWLQRGTVRHRAGWTLIEIGLRLAGGSSDG
jgi:hypothetical protein